jgi:hypothetical protein
VSVCMSRKVSRNRVLIQRFLVLFCGDVLSPARRYEEGIAQRSQRPGRGESGRAETCGGEAEHPGETYGPPGEKGESGMKNPELCRNSVANSS